MDKAGYDDIKVKIDTAFESDVLREMFSGGAAVYCERNILLPQEVAWAVFLAVTMTKRQPVWVMEARTATSRAAAPHLFARPDRVVALPDKTYLLDYKFGARRPGHDSQMRRYIRLLERMGYPDVRGWLWYVVSGEMVEAGHDVKRRVMHVLGAVMSRPERSEGRIGTVTRRHAVRRFCRVETMYAVRRLHDS